VTGVLHRAYGAHQRLQPGGVGRLGQGVGQRPVMGTTGAVEQLTPGRGHLAVDAAPVGRAQVPGQQPPLLEPGDQPGGRALAEHHGVRELLHAHVPVVLAPEHVEHRELADAQVVAGLEGLPDPVLDA
jgi:hypothetical protein